MRVIAGSLGGRTFRSPHGNRTHPISDKIRGALFNALGDIEGLTILDAFAGSGALGFEAISRGAAKIVAIDSDPAAQRALDENVADLGLKGLVQVVHAAGGAWLDTADDQFDVVLLDPPYDRLQPLLLTELADRTVKGGVVVTSLPPRADFRIGRRFYDPAA